MRTSTVFLLLLAIAGILLIGRGITGYVSLETCCDASTCAPDRFCDRFGNIGAHESYGLLVMGASLSLISAMIFILRNSVQK